MVLPIYVISCFRLTKHHCRNIMSAMANFWKNKCDEKRKIHWILMTNCVSLKRMGFGFKDIEIFNQVLLTKQACRLFNEPNSLIAKLYKGRYFANKDFLECRKGYRPSYAWCNILFGRGLLSKGLIKSIGNGMSTYVLDAEMNYG